MTKYFALSEYGEILFGDEGFSNLENLLSMAKQQVVSPSHGGDILICKTIKRVKRPVVEALVEDCKDD